MINTLSPIMQAYLAVWVILFLAAMAILVRQRKGISLLTRAYWHYLTEPWKVVTFLVALTGFVWISWHTFDPTWDYIDAAFMSILTYLTAPWAIGTLYRAMHKKAKMAHAYVAICLWLFSASWSYDAYMLWREGYYPITWWSNLLLSSVLYIAAGLMWNLAWKEGRGTLWGFKEPNWPDVGFRTPAVKIMWIALPFIILVSIIIFPFII